MCNYIGPRALIKSHARDSRVYALGGGRERSGKKAFVSCGRYYGLDSGRVNWLVRVLVHGEFRGRNNPDVSLASVVARVENAQRKKYPRRKNCIVATLIARDHFARVIGVKLYNPRRRADLQCNVTL